MTGLSTLIAFLAAWISVAERAPCRAATALIETGQLEEAQKKLAEGLGEHRWSCAVAGLDTLSEAWLESASALERAGDADASKQAFKAALQLDPSSVEARQGMERVANVSPLFWRRLTGAASRWGLPLLSPLAVAALLVLVFRSRVHKPTLEVETFGSDVDATGLGETMAALLQERLMDLASGSSPERIRLVTGPIEEVSVPAEILPLVPASSPLIGAIAKVFSILSSGRALKLQGTLHPPGKRGAGVTLKLTQRDGVRATETFWAAEFRLPHFSTTDVDVSDYYRLSDFMAVWLLFELCGRLEHRPLRLLGTDDWKSYALFRAGLFAEADQEAAVAKELYRRALRRDANLRGARVNLARLLGASPRRTGSRLRNAIRLLEGTLLGADDVNDPSIYVARYLKAMYHSDLNEYQQSRREAEELVHLIGRAEGRAASSGSRSLLSAVHSIWRPAETGPTHLKAYLTAIRPAALIMLGTLEVLTDPPPGGNRGLARFSAIDEWSPLKAVQYNFACAYSMLAEKETDREDKKSLAERAVEHLRRALALDERLSKRARQDVSLKFVRTWSTTKAAFGRAIREAADGTRPEPAPQPESPLAGYALVGEIYAAKLSEIEITAEDELLKATATRGARSRLSRAAQVAEALVLRWAQMVELTRVIGIGATEANLLQLGGVDSLDSLAKFRRDASSLAAILEGVAPLLGVEAPSAGEVDNWITQSEQLPRAVET